MAEEKSAGVRINKPAIVFLIGLAVLINVTLTFKILNRPLLIPYATLLALIVSTVTVFRLSHPAETKPLPLVFVIAGLGAVSRMATICLTLLTFYLVIYGGGWLVTYLAALIGANWNPNLDQIAFYPSIIMLGAGSIKWISGWTNTMTKQLYPATAEVRPTFYESICAKRPLLIKWSIVALVFLAGLVIFFQVTGLKSMYFFIFLQVYVLYVGLPLAFPSEASIDRRTKKDYRAIEAVGKLLGAAGFQVISSPETGDTRIDPVLLSTDLFAYNDEKALVVNIKHNLPNEPAIKLVDALNVLTAARTLSLTSKELEIPTQNIVPVLVAIEGQVDKEIMEYARKVSVNIIETSEEEIDKALSSKDPGNELREVALRVFGKLIEKQAG